MINYSRELEADAQEKWQLNRTSSHMASIIDFAEADAQLERKYKDATA